MARHELGDAKPGDVLRNTHFDDRFTCPNCLTDHNNGGVYAGKPVFITCPCGARLRLEVEQVPEAACYIADPDDEDAPKECEACDATDADGNAFCDGCDCCSECCNCTPSDCDCDVCTERRENA